MSEQQRAERESHAALEADVSSSSPEKQAQNGAVRKLAIHMTGVTDLRLAVLLAPLRENAVSEEIIRPLSELLVTDLLVGAGRARSIRGFRLGVAIRGHRSLTLSWEPPNRYSNEAATLRSISGEVKL